MPHRRNRHPARVSFRKLATANVQPVDRVAYILLSRGVAPPLANIAGVVERYAAAGIRGKELAKRVNNCIEGKFSSTYDRIEREYPQYGPFPRY